MTHPQIFRTHRTQHTYHTETPTPIFRNRFSPPEIFRFNQIDNTYHPAKIRQIHQRLANHPVQSHKRAMLQVPHTNMFQTSYQQISDAERGFVDRIVRDIAEGAKRHGARVADLIDAPLPRELIERDTRGFLQRPMVLAAVTERLIRLQLQQDINLDRYVRELHAIATFSVEDIMRYDALGDPYFDLENATPEQLAAIESIDVEKSDGLSRSSKTKMKFKAHSKIAAIKILIDLHGGADADNPYRKSSSTNKTPTLTDQTTTQQAADEFQRFIGDE